jgi:hypothetical protein
VFEPCEELKREPLEKPTNILEEEKNADDIPGTKVPKCTLERGNFRPTALHGFWHDGCPRISLELCRVNS